MTAGEVEVRQYDGNKLRIEGYAAMFGKRSHDLGGFHEYVENSAFTKTLNEADVRGLWNHDKNYVLGRSTAGTLQLSTDSTGLHYLIDPPDTTWARDLMVSMERGDVSGSSFSFRTIKDDWSLDENDYPKRSLLEVGLIDVSVVTYPAYPDAPSGVRDLALAGIAERSGKDVEDLTPEELRALLAGSTGEPDPASDGKTEGTTPLLIEEIEAAIASAEAGLYVPTRYL